MSHDLSKGRGPFPTWEAGAIDALDLDRLNQVTDWSPERASYEIEKFNGFGYRAKGVNTLSLVVLEQLSKRQIYRRRRL